MCVCVGVHDRVGYDDRGMCDKVVCDNVVCVKKWCQAVAEKAAEERRTGVHDRKRTTSHINVGRYSGK